MKVLPGTQRTFVAILALGLFAMSASGVTDPDVWWHLRTGELILQTHSVPRADPYSFTRLGQPWVNHEWLSDVVIFSLYRVAGAGGLIVVFAAVIAMTFLLLFLRCPGHPFIAALITIWGAEASAATWGARPQMFSLLLASIFLFLLERSDRHPNCIWWAVPLMLLWVNLHAGYAIGIVLLALFLIGGILDLVFGFDQWPETAPRLRRLGFVLAACLALVPLNPSGARMYWYPLQTLHSPSMQNYIDEWFSPNFHQLKYLPVLLFILAILLGLKFSPRPSRPTELLLLSATLVAALRSVRHIPIFVLVAVPLLYRPDYHWMGNDYTIWLRSPRPSRFRTTIVANTIILLVFITFALDHVRTVIRGQSAGEAQHFPEAAADFILSNPVSRPILNYYNWGGYFVWRLYPNYCVYIDGRADVYGDAFLNDFASSFYVKGQWRQPLQRWGIRTVILPPDAPLVTALGSTPGWRQIYADSQAVVLTLGPPKTDSSQTEKIR